MDSSIFKLVCRLLHSLGSTVQICRRFASCVSPADLAHGSGFSNTLLASMDHVPSVSAEWADSHLDRALPRSRALPQWEIRPDPSEIATHRLVRRAEYYCALMPWFTIAVMTPDATSECRRIEASSSAATRDLRDNRFWLIAERRNLRDAWLGPGLRRIVFSFPFQMYSILFSPFSSLTSVLRLLPRFLSTARDRNLTKAEQPAWQRRLKSTCSSARMLI